MFNEKKELIKKIKIVSLLVISITILIVTLVSNDNSQNHDDNSTSSEVQSPDNVEEIGGDKSINTDFEKYTSSLAGLTFNVPSKFKLQESGVATDTTILLQDGVIEIGVRRFNGKSFGPSTGGQIPRMYVVIDDDTNTNIQPVVVDGTHVLLDGRKIFRDELKSNNPFPNYGFYSTVSNTPNAYASENVLAQNMEIFTGSSADTDGIIFWVTYVKGSPENSISDAKMKGYLEIADRIIASIQEI